MQYRSGPVAIFTFIHYQPTWVSLCHRKQNWEKPLLEWAKPIIEQNGEQDHNPDQLTNIKTSANPLKEAKERLKEYMSASIPSERKMERPLPEWASIS